MKKIISMIVLMAVIMAVQTPQSAQAEGKGKVIVIDAGHQTRANTGTEPNGPGSSTKKMKVTGGHFRLFYPPSRVQTESSSGKEIEDRTGKPWL